MVSKIATLLVGLFFFMHYAYSQDIPTPSKPLLAFEELKLVKSAGILITPAEMTKIIFEEIAASNDFETIFLKADYSQQEIENADILIRGKYELDGNLVTLNYQIKLLKTKSSMKQRISKIELAGLKKEVLANLSDIFVKVTINSEPVGCDIKIDDVFYGKTPLTIDKFLTGSHLCHITHDGYFGLFQEIEINEEQNFLYRLEPRHAANSSNPKPKGGVSAITKKIKYPRNVKKSSIKGKITLVVEISEKGNVTNVQVKQSLGNEELDRAVMEAVKATKWEPAQLNGKPVIGSTKIRIAFSKK